MNDLSTLSSCLCSLLCAAVISPSPSLFHPSSLFQELSPCLVVFPFTSAVIGRLFVCTNPCPACIPTVMSELFLTLHPPAGLPHPLLGNLSVGSFRITGCHWITGLSAL